MHQKQSSLEKSLRVLSDILLPHIPEKGMVMRLNVWLFFWFSIIQHCTFLNFQEALKKIELVHLLEVEEGTMLYDTEPKE